jgi:polyisoprenoid-binding protein YceI
MRRGTYLCSVLMFLGACSSATVAAEEQRFRLLPEESQIVTHIKDPFGNIVNGTVRLREGEARGDIDRLHETSSVVLEIDARTYNSNIGLRDQDVQKYYLKVEQYPSIRFDSTRVEKIERSNSPTEPMQLTVRGRLEIHGVRRELVIPVRLFYQTNRIVAHGNFRFVLEQFNIKIPQLLFLKAGNQVEVDFRIVGERQP